MLKVLKLHNITHDFYPFVVVSQSDPSVVLSQVAVAGGFALKTLDNGTVVMRNPSTVHLIPMLDSVLALARWVVTQKWTMF